MTTIALRKTRFRFNFDQALLLESVFDENQHPSQYDLISLAELMKIDVERLRIWFVNRRSMYKRTNGIRSRLSLELYLDKVLSESFEQCKYPDDNEIERLAKLTDCSPKRIRKWFMDRRRKEARDMNRVRGYVKNLAGDEKKEDQSNQQKLGTIYGNSPQGQTYYLVKLDPI